MVKGWGMGCLKRLLSTKPPQQCHGGADLSQRRMRGPQNSARGLAREDVVAELILMVNPLYRIMSVAMLNYECCLALRSVLGTSGVWPK